MKYTTVEQKGEIGYNQPFYGIQATDEELETMRLTGSQRLQIWEEHLEHSIKNLTTGEHSTWKDTVRWYVSHGSLPNNELLCYINSYKDVEVYANYFGERMDASFYERYKAILVKVEP